MSDFDDENGRDPQAGRHHRADNTADGTANNTADNSNTERILREALAARAQGAISDIRSIPPMTADSPPSRHRATPVKRRRAVVWLAPVAAAAAVAAVAVAATVALGHDSTSGSGTVAGPAPVTTHSQSVAPGNATTGAPTPSATTSGPPAKVVTVSSDLGDGEKVGVGEPIVLNFSPAPTDSSAFTKAAVVTVNGQPANGAWYWEQPYAGQPIEAHYREQGYWPADSTIQVKLPIGGLSAGAGLVYSGALSSVTFQTGDAHVSVVNGQTLQMTVKDNGQLVKTLPVSLGAAKTPTFNGIKVVMQKGEDTPGTSTLRPDGAVRMVGPGYDEIVDWSVRVTADGEYVHAAPWNSEIGQMSTSNGCTNLSTDDAQWFYDFSLLGDVVQYVSTNGTQLNPLDGLGDWNIPWGQWTSGGMLLTH
jgi:lipoprotein-anchoring transpeptidase ErfK/SrfK